MLIFQHNISYGFFSKENASFNIQKGKFSFFSQLSNSFYVHRFNESYEFLLEYPKELPGDYNRWIQNSNPLSETEIDGKIGQTASGFTPIFLTWPDYFGRLMKSISNQCLIDGQTGTGNWNYC